MNYKRFFIYWFPVIVWVGITFVMSSGMFSSMNTSRFVVPILRFFLPDISWGQIYMIHGIIRKLAHVTEYFVLGLLLYRAFKNDSGEVRAWRWVFYSFLSLTLLAAADEFHQSYVSSRTASISDVGIDSFGGILALIALRIWEFSRRIIAQLF